MSENLPRLGIETTFVLGSELDALEDHLSAKTRRVFIETPTNPNMEVFDIHAIADVARACGALTGVDHTSPRLARA